MDWSTSLIFEDPSAFVIEQHEYHGSKSAAWTERFPSSRDSLELCLNESGRGEVRAAGLRTVITPGRTAYYRPDRRWTAARRFRGGSHRFTTVRFQGEYLRDQLAASRYLLRPDLRASLFDERDDEPLCGSRVMREGDRQLLSQLVGHDLTGPGRSLYYQSKVLELIARNFFDEEGHSEVDEEELFCQRYRRITNRKVEKALVYLRHHFREDLSLTQLARAVGSSPSHLSRSVSEATGRTIRQHLRAFRTRHARRLLISGRCNCTEAAYEVGYQSLSHFTKAFRDEHGYAPSDLLRG